MNASLIVGLARLLKVLFGLDKPSETRIHEEKPPFSLDVDDRDVLASLGVRPFNRPTGEDSSGDREPGQPPPGR